MPKQPQQSEGMKAPPVVEETITEESEYDKDIQPEWLAMERRVKGHKSKPKSKSPLLPLFYALPVCQVKVLRMDEASCCHLLGTERTSESCTNTPIYVI